MFEKIDKRRLYELMDMYLSGQINAWTFCEEYHDCFGLEVDLKTLTKREEDAFTALSTVAGRFSKFEEDFKRYPGVYFTEEQLRQKVIETVELLKSQV
ncbi:MAG TPA: colicin immunity domain-containing protein [Chitinophagaceae bacterium]|nr:colicin immunity domain-containing protein [Chitinophagaceae bacterium]